MNYRNRARIKEVNPDVADALDDIMSQIQITQTQTNAHPSGEADAPPSISSITVSAAQGIFDVALSDNSSQVKRGINYFLEYSLTPSFSFPVVIDLGASRNWRGFLGNQTLYWRGYSSYPTSPRSAPVYFGSQQNPTAAVGGGASTGPAPLPSNGSGTSSGGGGDDGGFGNSGGRGRDLVQ